MPVVRIGKPRWHRLQAHRVLDRAGPGPRLVIRHQRHRADGVGPVTALAVLGEDGQHVPVKSRCAGGTARSRCASSQPHQCALLLCRSRNDVFDRQKQAYDHPNPNVTTTHTCPERIQALNPKSGSWDCNGVTESTEPVERGRLFGCFILTPRVTILQDLLKTSPYLLPLWLTAVFRLIGESCTERDRESVAASQLDRAESGCRSASKLHGPGPAADK